MIKQKQTMYLTAEAIYKYLLGKDDNIETLIICKSAEIKLITTDQSLYEALGSFEERSMIDYNKLVKLLEVTEIQPYSAVMKKPRKILTEQRVEQITKKAYHAKDDLVQDQDTSLDDNQDLEDDQDLEE